MKQYAVFIHGIRGATIEFNDTEFGEEVRILLEKNGCSIKPIKKTEEKVEASGGIGAAMVRQMIANYERQRY